MATINNFVFKFVFLVALTSVVCTLQLSISSPAIEVMLFPHHPSSDGLISLKMKWHFELGHNTSDWSNLHSLITFEMYHVHLKNISISPADQEFEHHVLPLEAHGTTDETRPKAQQSGHPESCSWVHPFTPGSLAGHQQRACGSQQPYIALYLTTS